MMGGKIGLVISGRTTPIGARAVGLQRIGGRVLAIVEPLARAHDLVGDGRRDEVSRFRVERARDGGDMHPHRLGDILQRDPPAHRARAEQITLTNTKSCKRFPTN